MKKYVLISFCFRRFRFSEFPLKKEERRDNDILMSPFSRYGRSHGNYFPRSFKHDCYEQIPPLLLQTIVKLKLRAWHS